MAITGSGAEDVSVQVGADGSGLNNAVDGMIDKLTSFKGVVGTVGAALGTLATKQLSDAISAAGDWESALADVEKVTDEQTVDELDREIRDLAESIPVAQEGLAELATQAGRMGAEGADEILEFTEVAAQMGAATTLAEDEAGTALGKMSSALNEPLNNVRALGDSINELSNNFQTTSDEIVDSTQRSGQALSTLGLESDEILGLSAAFNEISPTSRLAATRMEQVGESMMDPDNISLFADLLGVTSDEFESLREESPEETMMGLLDSVDGNQDALDTLNQELTTAQARAFRDSANSADEMRRAMEMSNDAMEEGGSLAAEVAIETDTLHGQKQLLSNQIRNIAIDTGDRFIPAITDALDAVSDAVGWFGDLNEASDGLLGAVSGIGTAVGGLALAVGVFVGGPAAALVAVLGAAAGAAVLFHDQLEPLGQIASDVFGTVHDAAANDLEAAQETITERIEGIRETVDNILPDVGELWSDHGDGILDGVEATYDDASEFVSDGLDVVEDTVDNVLGAAGGLWEEHEDDVVSAASDAYDSAESVVDSAISKVTPHVNDGLGAAESAWNTHGPNLESLASDTFGFITDEARNMAEGDTSLFAVINPGLASVVGGFRDSFGDVEETVSVGLDETRQAMSSFDQTLETELLNPLADGESEFRQTMDSVAESTIGALDTAREAVSEFVTAALESGIQPFLVSMTDLWETHFTGENGIVANTREALEAILNDIVIPILNLIEDAWDLFGDDLIQILEGIFGTLETAATIGMDAVLTAINVILNIISGDWEDAWENITGFTKRTWENLTDWIKGDAADMITGAFGIVIDGIKAVFSGLYDWLWGNSLIKDLFNDPVEWIESTGENLFTGAFETVTDAIAGVWTGLKETVTGTVGELVEDTIGMVSSAVDTVRDTWNDVVPDELDIDATFSVPEVTIGGGSIPGTDQSLPSRTVPGTGSTHGVQRTLDMPQLDTGAFIEEDGRAELHAGERVVPAAQVSDRGEVETSGGDSYVFNIYAETRRQGREAMKGLKREFKAQGLDRSD